MLLELEASVRTAVTGDADLVIILRSKTGLRSAAAGERSAAGGLRSAAAGEHSATSGLARGSGVCAASAVLEPRSLEPARSMIKMMTVMMIIMMLMIVVMTIRMMRIRTIVMMSGDDNKDDDQIGDIRVTGAGAGARAGARAEPRIRCRRGRRLGEAAA